MSVIKNLSSQDSHIRSLVKSLTWRVLSTFITGVIAFMVTGEIRIALIIGGIEFFIKFITYYFHERVWSMIH
jgi:uncharacterized membrane protein